MHRKWQLRLCRNAVEPWGTPEMITPRGSAVLCEFPIPLTSRWDNIILQNKVKQLLSLGIRWMAVFFFFLISDIIYGVKIPSLLIPLFQLFQSNQRLFSLCLLLGGSWGEKRQMVSFAKGKLRDHTYIFQLCGKPDAKILARSARCYAGTEAYQSGWGQPWRAVQ